MSHRAGQVLLISVLVILELKDGGTGNDDTGTGTTGRAVRCPA